MIQKLLPTSIRKVSNLLYELQGAASGRSSGDCRARLYGVSRGVGSLKWGMPGELSRKERELLQPGRRLCVGLVGHRVKGALDPIGLRSDPWSVLNLGRMREDARVSANRFDQRDVEHVASRLIFTAAHDPRLSGTSHTEFVPVWRLRNPLSHPRVPPRLPQRLWGLEFAGGPHSLFVLVSVYQTSGELKPCVALAAPVAVGSPPAPDLAGD